MNEEDAKKAIEDQIAAKKAQDEQTAKAREALEKAMAEPMAEDEAKMLIAEAEIRRCQINAYIQSLKEQIAAAESQLITVDCDIAMVNRRVLNKSEG